MFQYNEGVWTCLSIQTPSLFLSLLYRFSRKKSCMSVRHSSSNTPPTTSVLGWSTCGVPTQSVGGSRNGLHLGMGSHVTQGLGQVVRLGENPPLAHHHCPDGNLLLRCRLLSLSQRLAHILFVRLALFVFLHLRRSFSINRSFRTKIILFIGWVKENPYFCNKISGLPWQHTTNWANGAKRQPCAI